MKRTKNILFFLHIFIGLGAMAGGLAALTNPKAPMGIDISVLNGYQEVVALHVIFGMLGIVQGLLALAILTHKKLFPMNIVLKLLKR